ncbi:hypothetical protein LguiB_017294 [Lonicera macranthoides]
MATTHKSLTMSKRKRRTISFKDQQSQVTTKAPSNLDKRTSEGNGKGAIPKGPDDSSVLTSFESHTVYTKQEYCSWNEFMVIPSLNLRHQPIGNGCTPKQESETQRALQTNE